MPTTYKTLGQVSPSANSLTTLYTVPAANSAVCSTLTVCSISTATTFRVAVRPNGEAIANKHYVAYDAVINQGDTISLTIGMTLGANDVVSVYAAAANTAFNLFGSEIN